MGTQLPLPNPPPQFSAHAHCGQTAGWIKRALGTEVGLCPGHIVLDGDSAPLPKKGGRARSPIFGPFLLWPNGWMHHDATLLDVHSTHSPKWGRSPSPSLAHVHCGQTAGWIKMTLVMQVGLGPGYIVLDGDPAPVPKKGGRVPQFRPIFILAKRLDASRCHLIWR